MAEQSVNELVSSPVASDLLLEMEQLVRETFLLWEELRVGFSWRHYYFNHTVRVRNLAVELARREGADVELVALAATLHDVTKRYDGNLVTAADGSRVLDENGFWRNELLPPARQNEVTRLYDELELTGQMHHLSGAAVAEVLLRRRGLAEEEAHFVGNAIRAHVRGNGAQAADYDLRPECCVLHDADMTDANLGLVALFRNVGIHGHRHFEQTGEVSLEEYVEYSPTWVARKRDFLERMLTDSGRAVATARQQRLEDWTAALQSERSYWEPSRQWGLLGVFEFLLGFHEDPNMSEQLQALTTEWLPARRSRLPAGDAVAHTRLALAEEFVQLLAEEAAGRI